MRVIIIPAVILIVSIVCYFSAYSYAVEFALWLGVIASFVLAALGVLRSRREIDWLIILVSFTISMRIPSFFQTRSWGFVYPFVDSSFDLTLSNLIRESGRWYPGMGSEVIRGYSYYPILHIWTAITSNVTGMDAALLARIFPFLAGPLVAIFFYLTLRKILSKEVAIWSSLMYNLNGSLHFWEYFVRESIALIFFSMCLYIVFYMYKNREYRSRFFMLDTIVVFMTVSSHHWTSYNLALTLIVLWIFPSLYVRAHAWLMNLRLHHKHMVLPSHQVLIMPSFLALTLVITLLWGLYIAYNIFSIHAHEFLSFILNVIMPSPSFVGHSVGALDPRMRFLLYFGYFVLGMLGVSELIRQFLKRQKTYDESIFEFWFVFCGVYILVSTFLIPPGTEWWRISWRSWSFAFFGLVPLGAMSIIRMQHWKKNSKLSFQFKWLSYSKSLAPFVLIFPLISAVLMAPPEILSPGYPHVGDSFYYTAQWVRLYLPNEKIALDPWARSVIIPYGRALTLESLRWPGGFRAFLNIVYESGNFSDFPSPTWRIVIFNRRISEWVPTASTNSSVLDQHYNRIYDSESLTINIITTQPV